jgi:dicarboxylate/amino acid:cation (Na+ or H+) symporter, DAACS family
MQSVSTSSRISLGLPLQMFAGLVIGLILALVWPSFAASLQPVGTAFIEAIRMIIIPLIVSSVTLGTYKMGRDIRQLGRVAAVAFAGSISPLFARSSSRWCSTASFIPGSGSGWCRPERSRPISRCQSTG